MAADMGGSAPSLSRDGRVQNADGSAPSLSRDGRVQVFCRIAPDLEEGNAAALAPCLQQRAAPAAKSAIFLQRSSGGGADGSSAASGTVSEFHFDGVLGAASTNADLFAMVCADFSALWRSGLSATVMAYGQSATGKTYSLLGPRFSALLEGLSGQPAPVAAHSSDGLLPRLLRDYLPARATAGRDAAAAAAAASAVVDARAPEVIELSCMQLYCEELLDLLAPPAAATATAGDGRVALPLGLAVREHPLLGMHVRGLSWHAAPDAETALLLVAAASRGRAVASTRLNAASSRSHLICILRRRAARAAGEAAAIGGALEAIASLTIVDLAGSERIKKAFPQAAIAGPRGGGSEAATPPSMFALPLSGSGSGATTSEPPLTAALPAATLGESRAINLSLTALGNVIAALARRSKLPEGSAAAERVHIPVRNSVLTRLLQGSLGGEARTALLITVSAAPRNASESLSTLEFGARASAVRTRQVPRIGSGGGAAEAPPACACCRGGASCCAHAGAELAVLREELHQLRRRATTTDDGGSDGSGDSAAARPDRAAGGGGGRSGGDAVFRTASSCSLESADIPETETAAAAEKPDAAALSPSAAAETLVAAPPSPSEAAAAAAASSSAAAAATVTAARADVAAARRAAAEASEARAASRDELLEVLALYREARALLRENAAEHAARMGEAAEELAASGAREAALAEELAAARAREAAATGELGQLRRGLAAAAAARARAGGADATVAQLTAAYEGAISALLARVEALEQRQQAVQCHAQAPPLAAPIPRDGDEAPRANAEATASLESSPRRALTPAGSAASAARLRGAPLLLFSSAPLLPTLPSHAPLLLASSPSAASPSSSAWLQAPARGSARPPLAGAAAAAASSRGGTSLSPRPADAPSAATPTSARAPSAAALQSGRLRSPAHLPLPAAAAAPALHPTVLHSISPSSSGGKPVGAAFPAASPPPTRANR